MLLQLQQSLPGLNQLTSYRQKRKDPMESQWCPGKLASVLSGRDFTCPDTLALFYRAVAVSASSSVAAQAEIRKIAKYSLLNSALYSYMLSNQIIGHIRCEGTWIHQKLKQEGCTAKMWSTGCPCPEGERSIDCWDNGPISRLTLLFVCMFCFYCQFYLLFVSTGTTVHYASMGRALETYGSWRVCPCVCVILQHAFLCDHKEIGNESCNATTTRHSTTAEFRPIARIIRRGVWKYMAVLANKYSWGCVMCYQMRPRVHILLMRLNYFRNIKP